MSDTITKTKEWSVADMNKDVEFRIAGHHVGTGQLHSSEAIVFVNNLLTTNLILFGPIVWE